LYVFQTVIFVLHFRLSRRLEIADGSYIPVSKAHAVFKKETGIDISTLKFGRSVHNIFPEIKSTPKRNTQKKKLERVHNGLKFKDKEDDKEMFNDFIKKYNTDDNIISFMYLLPNVMVNDMDVLIHIDWYKITGRLTIRAFGNYLDLKTFDIPTVINEQSMPALLRVIRNMRICTGFEDFGSNNPSFMTITTTNERKIKRRLANGCLRFLTPIQHGETCVPCNIRKYKNMRPPCNEPNTIELSNEDDNDMLKMFEAVKHKLEGHDNLRILLESQLLNIQKQDRRGRRWHPKYIHNDKYITN
jgi:hypothetical protein